METHVETQRSHIYYSKMRLPACLSVAAWLALASAAVAQTIVTPSNNSQDLYPIATSPRFLLNGTEFPNLPPIGIAPIGDYARMSHSAFVNVEVEGFLVNIDASNVNDWGNRPNQRLFAYLSCDPEAYTGNLDASDVFRLAVNRPQANIVILYSKTSDHCAVSGLDSLPAINGILTTTEAMAARMLADLGLGANLLIEGSAVILPDLNAYTNSSRDSGWSNGFGQSPTTAVAMIILYSITGIITALFVVIIVTGAIRAHRHPERYGPRTIIGGRGRQSRARGIARAMLDTLPIVKFGDKLEPHATAKNPSTADIEMNNPPNAEQPTREAKTTNNTDADHSDHTNTATGAAQHDGTDEQGQLGCSICTEDFTKGEEVRVLPCNHKFHPDCVDPWLLNVSGTCPLCRIDLRPQAEEAETVTVDGDGALPPPLGGRRETAAEVTQVENGPSSLRRDTITQLRRLAAGSNEDRIAALRRYRLERRATRSTTEQDESERRGLARRLRERFRVRTERRSTMTEIDFRRRGTFGGPVRGG